MKKTDLTQPGGFPLDQDQLNHLQQGYIECLNELALVLGDNSGPYIIRGCDLIRMAGTFPYGIYTISPGSIFWNGDIIVNPTTTASISIDESTDAPYLQLSTSNSSLTFNDGSTPVVVLDNRPDVNGFAIGTADDSTKVLWSHIKPMGVGLMENIMDNIYTPYIAPTYAGSYIDNPTSPIRFRKPIGSKTVTIKGVTDATLGMSFITDSVVFILPFGYRPISDRIFITYNGGLGVIRVKTNGEVSIAGDIIGAGNIGCWMNISFDID